MEAKLEVLIVSSQGTHGGNRSWKSKEGPSSRVFGVIVFLPSPLTWTASLQNFEVIHFCFCMSLGLWFILQ